MKKYIKILLGLFVLIASTISFISPVKAAPSVQIVGGGVTVSAGGFSVSVPFGKGGSSGGRGEGTIKGLNQLSPKPKLSLETNIGKASKDIGLKVVNIIRWVVSAVIVIFLVYAGAQMIMSMGSDEEELSKAKRSIMYAIIGLFFINFPVAIYNAIVRPRKEGNLFIVEDIFANIIMTIINFIEILLIGIAIVMVIISAIKILKSRGREDQISEAKSKLVWLVAALIFIGFIEIWKAFIIGQNGDGSISIQAGVDIFQSVANLLLYLAGPVALFFLTLAGYYYIISNGDEEKTKKGKSIVINTFIGIIVLLCAYILLNDLSTFTTSNFWS